MQLQGMVMALVVLSAFGGCATFSMGGHKALVRGDDASAEAVFRREAQALQRQFTKTGWSRAEESKSRTRAFLSFLSKGWSKSKTKTSGGAVTLYLARLGVEKGLDDKKITLKLQSDTSEALNAMRRLNDAAESLVALRPQPAARALRTDVAMLEHSLIMAHKAQSLFAGAWERLGDRLAPPAQAELAAQLKINAGEIARMQGLADRLNVRRLAKQPVS